MRSLFSLGSGAFLMFIYIMIGATTLFQKSVSAMPTPGLHVREFKTPACKKGTGSSYWCRGTSGSASGLIATNGCVEAKVVDNVLAGKGEDIIKKMLKVDITGKLTHVCCTGEPLYYERKGHISNELEVMWLSDNLMDDIEGCSYFS